jgi:rhodanese-related sulfurtransferase
MCSINEKCNLKYPCLWKRFLPARYTFYIGVPNIEKNQQIIFVCHHGNDSQLAVRRLKELLSDIDNIDEKIKDLEGGFQAWHTDIDSTFPLY